MQKPRKPAPQSAPRLPSDLGEVRTVMAADRTMMAWVRTALSMFSFSFAIYKFLEGLKVEKLLGMPNSPQHVGLFLSGLGVLSLIMGAFEYRMTLKDLNKTGPFMLRRPVFLIAVILSVAGVALFVSIARNML